jgi:hypothetical protein
VSDTTHENLLSFGPGAPATLLPEDPAAAEVAERGTDQLIAIVSSAPASSMCWALLAETALGFGSAQGDVAAYAYARTGYHRGLDALRRAGWKGSGPIPWEHEPNRGFLRALYALALAAQRIDDTAEYERCSQLLRDSSATGYRALTGG